MIYIFTALYCEAHIFIEAFDLKKDAQALSFQQFYNASAGVRLTISGAGEIAAASAVSSICTKYQPGQGDFLLNAGTCAGAGRRGEIFLIHKLVEQASEKTFYPDILYRHPFQEKNLVTVMTPWDGSGDSDSLYDMEAAAVYQAGAYFFAPHQMLFLKIVLDNGSDSSTACSQKMQMKQQAGQPSLPPSSYTSGSSRRIQMKQQAGQLMELHRDSILGFIRQLISISRDMENSRRGGSPVSQEENDLVRKLCADMHCSKTMEHSLRQHIHYLALTGADYQTVIQEWHQENNLPCRDKREGKKCLERLKERLLFSK